MTLFSEAKGRKVVAIDTAVTAGKIGDWVVDPGSTSIAALVLKKTAGDEEILPWSNITAFGDDAVTITTDAAIVAADDRLAELADKAHSLHGKRVLTTDGEEIGNVKDISFEPTTGKVTGLILKDEEIDAVRLVAAGSYAVIVRV